MDIDNIPFGTDFRTHIRDTLVRSDVLIALIGANWLGIYPDGRIKMQEKTDPVRVEIETALENKVAIIPVLLDGAQMPKSTELPQELGNFSFLNAAEVTSGREFPQSNGAPHRRHRPNHLRQFGCCDYRFRDSTNTNAGRRGQGLHCNLGSTMYCDASQSRLFYFLFSTISSSMHTILTSYICKWPAWLCRLRLAPFSPGRAGAARLRQSPWRFALGIVADAGMTVSQSLYSGDPIMPQARVEWWDNFNFAAIMALSYSAGIHLLTLDDARDPKAKTDQVVARRPPPQFWRSWIIDTKRISISCRVYLVFDIFF